MQMAFKRREKSATGLIHTARAPYLMGREKPEERQMLDKWGRELSPWRI